MYERVNVNCAGENSTGGWAVEFTISFFIAETQGNLGLSFLPNSDKLNNNQLNCILIICPIEQ